MIESQKITANVLFAGNWAVGKTSIFNAVVSNMPKRFNPEVYRSTAGIAFQLISFEDQFTKFNLTLFDTSSSEKIDADFLKDFQLLCIVVNASDSIKMQLASIEPYLKIFHKQNILVIANKKTDHAEVVLDDVSLTSIGLLPYQYIRISAKEITESDIQKEILINKLLYMVNKIFLIPSQRMTVADFSSERSPLIQHKPAESEPSCFTSIMNFFCCVPSVADDKRTQASTERKTTYTRLML